MDALNSILMGMGWVGAVIAVLLGVGYGLALKQAKAETLARAAAEKKAAAAQEVHTLPHTDKGDQ